MSWRNCGDSGREIQTKHQDITCHSCGIEFRWDFGGIPRSARWYRHNQWICNVCRLGQQQERHTPLKESGRCQTEQEYSGREKIGESVAVETQLTWNAKPQTGSARLATPKTSIQHKATKKTRPVGLEKIIMSAAPMEHKEDLSKFHFATEPVYFQIKFVGGTRLEQDTVRQ